jgi:serine/threonine-protein kinase ULK4
MCARYETRKHLWLVLEYCVGGNLRALLEADKKLPETSIRIFMRSLAQALQHVHAVCLCCLLSLGKHALQHMHAM